MPLNRDQQEAFIDVIAFINSSEKFMNISGPAGVGKTYLISEIADNILKLQTGYKTLKSVHITATTNKAAAVIRSEMASKNFEITTIYALMNLRVKEDYSTGMAHCVPTPKWAIHSNELIIVDEASMINAQLFRYLEKGTDSTCKIIFVSDQNQLSPVGEPISLIYAQGYKTTYLTKPVRNAESPALMELCEQAKQTVLTGVFTPIKPVPGIIDLIDGTQLRGVLEREYINEDTNRRVISYTNKRVVEYNTFIRLAKGYRTPFVVGEVLSNNTSAEVVGKDRLYTDQIVKVVSIIEKKMSSLIIKDLPIHVLKLQLQDFYTQSYYIVDCFANPQDRDAALKYYSSRKQWQLYFKIKNNYPDLRPIAASTTHKAQGSTYQSVVVDLADIGKSTNRDQTARMQYVALSRPKTRIYIRGRLPDRYFEI